MKLIGNNEENLRQSNAVTQDQGGFIPLERVQQISVFSGGV
jgi:hypothetical protein